MAAMATRPTEELRVPMVPVAVEIAGVHAPPAPCEVYVADTPRHGRTALADDLAALLESAPPFLPVRFGAGVSLVGKHAIQWVAFALHTAEPAGGDDFGDTSPDDGPREPSEVMTLFDSKHDVEITLVDGSTLTGSILHSSPADKPRVIDYLNRPARFVRLWTPRAQYLINKEHVARVREVG
jgi:hypothetical protein